MLLDSKRRKRMPINSRIRSNSNWKAWNLFEQIDSIGIIDIEKDTLLIQPINQLYISGIVNPYYEYQRTQEMEIFKTPLVENKLKLNIVLKL